MRPLRYLLLSLVLLVGLSCDKLANPTAPAGSVLKISASPSLIALVGEGARITVSGVRPDGKVLSPGTLIQLLADRGVLRPDRSSGCSATVTVNRLEVDSNGQVSALLCGNGQSGAAMVTARLVNSLEGEVMVSVQIGADASTQPMLIISANPTVVATGESSEVTILARGSDGSPLGGGQRIRLTSDLGDISCDEDNSCTGNAEDPCAAVCTNNSGEAQATFTAGNRSGTGAVAAILGTSELQAVNITINSALDSLNLTVAPQSITRSPAPGAAVILTAVLLDPVGTPLNAVLVRFDSDVGSLDSAVAQTNTQGQVTVTLTVLDTDVQNIPANGTFTVTATATSEGETRSDSKQVIVLGSP